MDVGALFTGEGGGGGEVDGNTGFSWSSDESPPTEVSATFADSWSAGPAWAKRRESDEGPAVGIALDLGGEGNSRELGERVALNDSSASTSWGEVGGMGMGIGGDVNSAEEEPASGADAVGTFLLDVLRLDA